ncbi:MAG: ADP-forming succinate--CoA ligase subunit beta, partial [Phycisphaeraceae bacterium]
MKIHEYQSRELMEQFGIPVPAAVVIDKADEAADAYRRITEQEQVKLGVVKAQVHAGGRGKAGGVKLVKSADEAADAAKTILAKPLVTHQTGPEGVPVNKLLIAAGVDIEKEYYLAIAVDRALGVPVMVASAEGGVEIEEVARTNPDAILREPVNPETGLKAYQARKLAFGLGFKGQQIKQAMAVMTKLSKLFLDTDASLAEINPLVVTPADKDNPDGRVLAIDAKINFDDNALFRHKDIAALEDYAETPESERRASEHGLNFIQLDGNIGCLVNGAGLAMATMDIIKHFGGEPANFL